MAKYKKNNKFLFFLIIILIFLGIIYLLKNKKIMKYIEHFSSDGIPKIIHQIAPADVNKWKPEWIECHKTWKVIFPDVVNFYSRYL